MFRKNYIVPIPKERVGFKKSGDPNARYVYYITRRYRNKNGTPTCDEKLIGKEAPNQLGWMIPNKNYAIFFPEPEEVRPLTLPVKTRQAGQGMLLTMLAENLGLCSILEEIFPNYWRELLMCAIYMVCEGNVMMNADFFWDEIQIPAGFDLSPQRISELFFSVSEEALLCFFKAWSNLVLKHDEAVAYDVTSISTYADFEIAEYGYNRDHESLPQVNYGLLYGSLCKLPIAYSLYSGSINDLTFFPYMMRLAEQVGVSNIFYILDRGFITRENLAFARENRIDFLAGAPKDEKVYKNAMKEVAQEIKHPKYRIQGSEYYGITSSLIIDGYSYGLYVYYNRTNAEVEENRLFEHVDRLENEIKKEMKPKRYERYKKYYTIEDNREGKILSYERDFDKIAEICELLGMFCFLSTKEGMTPAEALELYRRRNEIEKVYDTSKNELEADRFLTHSGKTTRGKHFVHFLALILWSDLQRKVKACEKKPEKTIQRILLRMKKIKCIDYATGRTLEEPLTRKQKDILACCGIDENIFRKRILSESM